MKKILIISFVLITKVMLGQSYYNEPLKFNNLKIDKQKYTYTSVLRDLNLNDSKISTEREFDGEYHSGYINSYYYYPDGNLSNNLEFKFGLEISEDDGEYFVINATSETNDVKLTFLGHTFTIGSTTKNSVDQCLTKGKELVNGSSTHYRLYTDQGYLYLGFDENKKLNLIEIDCNCQ